MNHIRYNGSLSASIGRTIILNIPYRVLSNMTIEDNNFQQCTLSDRIVNGYGEFIVYPPDEKVSPVTQEQYRLIYEILSRYSAGGFLSNCKSGKIREKYMLRHIAIERKVKKVRSDLNVAFIPRTLYELLLLRKSIRENIKINRICPKQKQSLRSINNELSQLASDIEELENDIFKVDESYSHIDDEEKRNRYIEEDRCSLRKKIKKIQLKIDKISNKKKRVFEQPCWHHWRIEGVGDIVENNDEGVISIAFKLNHIFAKICSSLDLPFFKKNLDDLLDIQLKFFQDYFDEGQKEKESGALPPTFVKDIAAPSFRFRYNRYTSPMAICGEGSRTVFRKIHDAECSEPARHSIFLCRGGSAINDSPKDRKKTDEAFSLSYGTGLLSGVMFDEGATPWQIMRNTGLGYFITIPIESVLSSGIYFPRSNAICQFYGRGETFHARSMVPKSLGNAQKINGLGMSIISTDHLITDLCLEEIDRNFRQLKKELLIPGKLHEEMI